MVGAKASIGTGSRSIDARGTNGVKSPSVNEKVDLGPGLLRALRNADIVVICQAPDFRVRWAQNVPPAWADGDIIGKTDREFLPAVAADRIVELKQAVIASGAPERHEFRDGAQNGGRWYDMWIDADLGDDGSVDSIITTIVDITEQKHREQTLRTLLREVSHRSKNLLAIILSIATQTGRYSGSIEVFLERFRGRIQSLASSQDLVTSSNWRGAMLSDLIEGQVARYRGNGDDGVWQDGVDVYLNPNAALHIGLALHELVVNSMSHGALAKPHGRVQLTTSLTRNGDGDQSLTLVWRERTAAAGMNDEKRFGSVALERVVPVSLDGKATFRIDGDLMEYRLEVPDSNFEAD